MNLTDEVRQLTVDIRDPKIGRSGVEEDLEVLRRRPDLANSEILSVSTISQRLVIDVRTRGDCFFLSIFISQSLGGIGKADSALLENSFPYGNPKLLC